VKGRPDIVSRTVVREKAGKRFRVTFEIPGAIPGKAVKVAISAGGRSLTKVVRLGRA
jgi:hypothetical protein